MGSRRAPEGWGAPGLGTPVRVRRDDGTRFFVTVLDEGLLPDGVAVSRFLVAVHGLRTIAHPNLVRVEVVDREAAWVLVGGPVGDGVPLSQAASVAPGRLALDLARGLAVLHHHRAAHGVLHPGAVFVGGGGSARIAQFGICAQVDRARLVERAVADPSLAVAPELLDVSEPISPRMDVFGFGVVVAAAAMPGRSLTTVVARARDGAIETLGPALSELVARCLSVDPAARPDGGDELLARVERALAAADASTATGRVSTSAPSLSLTDVDLVPVGDLDEAAASSEAMELDTADLSFDVEGESPAAPPGGAPQEPPLLELARSSAREAPRRAEPAGDEVARGTLGPVAAGPGDLPLSLAPPEPKDRPAAPRAVLAPRTTPAGPPGALGIAALTLVTLGPVAVAFAAARSSGGLARLAAAVGPARAGTAPSSADAKAGTTGAVSPRPGGEGTEGPPAADGSAGREAEAPVPPDRPPPKPARCPPGAVRVGPKVCMDRAEHPGLGRIPTVGITHRAAAGLCEARGGRLCTRAEWQAACAGPGGWAYPYGPTFALDRCNTASPAGYPQEVGIAGSWSACRTPTGIYDLAGNVGEWVAEGLALGGDSTTPAEVAGCTAQGRPPPGYAGPELGTRCCYDLGADPP